MTQKCDRHVGLKIELFDTMKNMTSLCKTLKTLNKEELNEKLEEYIVNKAEPQDKKIQILLKTDNKNLSEAEKQKLKKDLGNCNNEKLQSKLNKIDLVKVVTKEKM